MAPMVPQSFVENIPKLRVVIQVIEERAKYRGEPGKMTHSSETETFGGVLNGKNIALGIVVICSVDKNRDQVTTN